MLYASFMRDQRKYLTDDNTAKDLLTYAVFRSLKCLTLIKVKTKCEVPSR